LVSKSTGPSLALPIWSDQEVGVVYLIKISNHSITKEYGENGNN